MSESWNTKYGPRRVRRDPPTLAEAIAAAQGLSDDRELQAEIAAGLMGAPIADVRSEMRKLGADRAVLTTMVASGRDRAGVRAVVVERKTSRRIASVPGRVALSRPALGRPATLRAR